MQTSLKKLRTYRNPKTACLAGPNQPAAMPCSRQSQIIYLWMGHNDPQSKIIYAVVVKISYRIMSQGSLRHGAGPKSGLMGAHRTCPGAQPMETKLQLTELKKLLLFLLMCDCFEVWSRITYIRKGWNKTTPDHRYTALYTCCLNCPDKTNSFFGSTNQKAIP